MDERGKVSKEALGFKVAAWVLTVTKVVPKDEVIRRLRKAINEELRMTIKRGTVVEITCPMCKSNFTHEVYADNAQVPLYCGKSCKRKAVEKRKTTKNKFCRTPQKNKYPCLEVARKHANLMDGPEAWKLTPYPCSAPDKHWHLGRLEGRIVSTPNEKRK